jgi:hypothetical protein
MPSWYDQSIDSTTLTVLSFLTCVLVNDAVFDLFFNLGTTIDEFLVCLYIPACI